MTLRIPSSPALVVLAALAACSPKFNWRDVRHEGGGIVLLLPCKPDKAEKTVPLGARPTPLQMIGCEAGGVTFAVAVADVGDAREAASVLAQWQNLTLANMKAGAPRLATMTLAGASNAVRTSAQGRAQNGRAVSSEAAYFSRGSQVFQVVMYAPEPMPDVTETFFSSLKFD